MSKRFQFGVICSIAAAVALGFCAVSSEAANMTYTSGSGVWESTAAWTTNLCWITDTCAPGGTGGYPAQGGIDGAFFTNAATYSVTIASGSPALGGYIQVGSNFFSNVSNTLATVTLNIANTGVVRLEYLTQFIIGDRANSTSVVYLASNVNSPAGLYNAGGSGQAMTIGRNGDGTLIVTNGTVSIGSLNMGSGSGGRGTLIVSGPSTTFQWGNSSGGFAVAGNSNTFNHSIIVTNGATFRNIANGTFRFGSGSAQCNTSNNVMVINSGGKVLLGTGTITIGNGSTFTFPGEGAFNNAVIVGNNGTLNCGGNLSVHSLFIGTSKDTPASNNVLRVLSGGTAYNFSQCLITSNNAVELLGGNFGGADVASGSGIPYQIGGVVTNEGKFQGYGIMNATLSVASNGVLATSNNLGSLVFSNSLNLTSNHVMQVALGSVTFPTIITSNLQIRVGKLNITDSGGFAPGTYTLFNYGTDLTFEGWTLGTVPDNSLTYTLDTNTPSLVKLIVTGVGAGPFQITSIARQANDMVITWLTTGGTTNIVQVTPGAAGGSYSNNFVNLSGQIIAAGVGSVTTNYLDVGGALNSPSRYYRIKRMQ